MTAQSAPTAAVLRGRNIERWRRRSRIIRVLRVVGPTLIVLILAGLGASIAYNAMKPTVEPAQEANQPIRLINPRFVGRDARGRAFVVTAASATRDPQEYQKVYLDRPALVLDEQGSDPTRIVSAKGVFHEQTGKLELSGGLRMSSSQGTLETAESKFDTKTGDLVGSGPVHGSGPLGDIDATSYGVYEKGDHMVFQGRAHARFYPKK
ncbi:LPS export ABC transporter periplasmic protein LptC [Phenylobacterium sp.]|uniref:LPS export ABC transporter periplasmic protein LptC n=1 Tax=Phenylobacterium sp. TaxID=1871053 RepID=UPI002DE44A39|nr:LPS export ABC transporter periplasmic protein LptC [Phenylobacterium sp.]